MAKKGEVSTTNSFTKGVNNDMENIYSPESSWIYARNAITSSEKNDYGQIGNEPANFKCVGINKTHDDDYVIIGAIHLDGQRWAIYSCDESNPNNVKSEIGVFNADLCEYETKVNDPCLRFSQKNLITGVAKENADCTWQTYWSDGRRNPDRTMNIDNIPWKQDCIKTDCKDCDDEYCWECTDTDELDCQKIRLSPLLRYPCLNISKGSGQGEILNGSYYVVARYLIKGQPIGSYSLPSNIVGVFTHENIAGSLHVDVEFMDSFYDEFELVVVANVNGQQFARRVGVYDIGRRSIYIDQINEASMVTVPISEIPIQNEVFDSSNQISRNGEYLLRIGTQSRFDFNYQPLANDIVSKWQIVEYPSDYYRKAGTNMGFMGDENYTFFIRWVYDNGQRTSSYVISGRESKPSDLTIVANNDANFYIDNGEIPYNWKVNNTALLTQLHTPPITLPDGGEVIAEGEMGYHETTEVYPNDRPDIWGDLCGKHIRLHKFPANVVWDGSNYVDITNHYSQGGDKIRIKAVKFENIKPPVDNNGNQIEGIIGYEILRGSREGNKTILSKGMLNNMRYYEDPEDSSKNVMYQNYPYNDLSSDGTLNKISTDKETTNFSGKPNRPHDKYAKKSFTYHSPDNMFNRSFLSQKGIRIYGNFKGTTDGSFVEPKDHPKHKLLNIWSFLAASIVGVAGGLLTSNGTKTVRYSGGRRFNLGQYPDTIYNNLTITPMAGAGSSGGGTPPGVPFQVKVPNTTTTSPTSGDTVAKNTETELKNKINDIIQGPIGGGDMLLDMDNIMNKDGVGYIGGTAEVVQNLGDAYAWGSNGSIPINGLPGLLNGKTIMLVTNTIQAADVLLRAIYNLSPYRQYGLQYQSHCFYNEFENPKNQNGLRETTFSAYVDNNKVKLSSTNTLNNIFRSSTIALSTKYNVEDPQAVDNSRVWLGRLNNDDGSKNWYKNPTQPVERISTAHYIGLKQDLKNQYGQLRGVNQVPMVTCPIEFDGEISETGTIFGGDIYIGRYTEKNTFFYFYDWLHKQPDGMNYNYKKRNMLAFSSYGIDSNPFDMSEFIQGLNPFNIISGGFLNTPLTKFTLDHGSGLMNFVGLPDGFFTVKDAYFYLFQSGVRDFFVETEMNIDYRDWGEPEYERHYDPYRYTTLSDLFDISIIKSTNYYKYDDSLSIRRMFSSNISWGNLQQRMYDPLVAETCYVYRPKKIIYSLPQNLESNKDFWRAYLTNNYKEFSDDITGVKQVGQNGALILFKHNSPILFQGVEQMKLESGTKLTIGDGELFMQPMQHITNSDLPYEYGSCQHSRAIVNTPTGLYWASTNQGKIFRYQNAPVEISIKGLNAWLAKYLPIKLLEYYPDFELDDNTVIGVGVQMTYDNKHKILYIAKKDYVPKESLINKLEYIGGNKFSNGLNKNIELGDPDYFDSASWTVSYNTMSQEWVSYHDWHPELLIPLKDHFIATMRDGLWKHNSRCDLYCNFFGKDYPFEVGFIRTTPQMVNTIRNVEYYLEVFKYNNNCYDRFHVLDENFDEAVIYNTEQCSGLLKLNLYAKNDIAENLKYPIVNPGHIDILYSKEEHKYRFNQFWDITDDRGEFNPSAERSIWNTEANGYIKNLNLFNLNYYKDQMERKKFRHYKNMVLLRKTVSGNKKFLLSLVNVKHDISAR